MMSVPDKAVIFVSGAGNKECNGIYTVTRKRGGKPEWDNKETGAYILWWGGRCGWEMYDKYDSSMCRYWTEVTDDDTYPWRLGTSKWIVRPGNKNMEPPPTVIGKYIIGLKVEQELLEEFLINKLRVPDAVAKLPWLYEEIMCK